MWKTSVAAKSELLVQKDHLNKTKKGDLETQ